ncbi:Atg14 domain-containing protein [Aspergillus lucknowensis]|uniref:Autophagy-related protein 14 n=1 Tax=Aspergillus lucknowensis TaxID=176173 RepID=A0ABR4LZI4_9EURO
MSCDICTRAQTSRLHLLCPTCARNQLYSLRLESATLLLEKESLSQQVEAAVKPKLRTETPSDAREKYDTAPKNGSSNPWTLQIITSNQVRSSGRMRVIATQIESIQSEIKNKNFDVSRRKLELARRRSDSESAKYHLTERETGLLAGIQNNNKRTHHLWNSLHAKTAEARIFLCREAASLYGLRQKVRKVDNGLKESYVIGGVNIIDLRDMNGKSYPCATPDQLSTSFTYIAHILVLVSHYLSLRLPAEIIPPHKNYPTPTIYAPSASYLPRDVTQEPSNQSSSSSPTTSRTADSRSLPSRPRPLCIDKSLPKLAKEDPGTYAHFIEGVALLAWNVCWLSRSQGLNSASDSWEDVCDIGKNLWQLLVAPPGKPSTFLRTHPSRDIQAKPKAPKDPPRTTLHRTNSFPMLGHYSHGTAHSFLSASEGTEFIRSWKLPTPMRVTDGLKSTLLGEMASAEWELLEEKEWDDVPQDLTQPVFRDPGGDPGTARNPQLRVSDTDSIVSKPARADTNAPDSPPRSKGTSGWTKLRNR